MLRLSSPICIQYFFILKHLINNFKRWNSLEQFLSFSFLSLWQWFSVNRWLLLFHCFAPFKHNKTLCRRLLYRFGRRLCHFTLDSKTNECTYVLPSFMSAFSCQMQYKHLYLDSCTNEHTIHFRLYFSSVPGAKSMKIKCVHKMTEAHENRSKQQEHFGSVFVFIRPKGKRQCTRNEKHRCAIFVMFYWSDVGQYITRLSWSTTMHCVMCDALVLSMWNFCSPHLWTSSVLCVEFFVFIFSFFIRRMHFFCFTCDAHFFLCSKWRDFCSREWLWP